MEPAAGRSTALLVGLVALAVARPVACGGDEVGRSSLDRRIEEVLAAVWPEVVEPAARDAVTAAAALEAACRAWSEAEAVGVGGDEARAQAQTAWFDLMARWQRLEAMQVGPAAASLSAVGGLGLRDAIYSWPTTNACRVDQETVERGFDDPAFFAEELVNVYGLDALETLLFSVDGENACPPQVTMNADGSWAALGPAGVRQNRADYAAAVAGRLVADLDALVAAWDPEAGDFAGQLARAGADGSPFESREAGLNAVFDALFYLDSSTKDGKLGSPLGLVDCGATSCLHLVETPVAGGSHLWVVENLVGFRALYQGGEGAGLDDLLVEVGHADVADAMRVALDEADAAAAALQIPVDEAVAGDPAAAIAAHAAIDQVTDRLKSDVAAALLLVVPGEAAGDND